MMNSDLANLEFKEYKDIAEAANLYGELYKEVSATAYCRARSDAHKTAGEVLEASTGLLGITPEYLLEHGQHLPLLGKACLPPLTRDRMAALTRVPSRHIASLENGDMPATASLTRKMKVLELPALCSLISESIDKTIAPWLLEDRLPRGYEAERFCSTVAERSACMSLRRDASGDLKRVLEGSVENWLVERGYERCIGAGNALGDTRLDKGMFTPEFRLWHNKSFCEAFMVAMPKESGKAVALFPTVYSDPANALRSRLRETTRERYGTVLDAGFECVEIVVGYVDNALVSRLQEDGIPFVWAHRLDDLASFGL